MSQPMSVPRMVADSAILGALAPATLILSGWSYFSAYQARLGLRDVAAMPPIHAAMVKGMWLLIFPALGLVVCYGMVWLLLSWQSKKMVPLPKLAEIPLLAWAAGGSWFAATLAAVKIGDDSPKLLEAVDFTMADVVVILFGVALVTVLIAAPLVGGVVAQFFAGPGLSGTVIVGVVLVAGLAAHASFMGVDDGSAHAWGCTDYPGVFLGAASNETTAPAYLLVAHPPGRYYMRDMELRGDELEIQEIAETELTLVRHVHAPALRDC